MRHLGRENERAVSRLHHLKPPRWPGGFVIRDRRTGGLGFALLTIPNSRMDIS
jgi:hypothetical protein